MSTVNTFILKTLSQDWPLLLQTMCSHMNLRCDIWKSNAYIYDETQKKFLGEIGYFYNAIRIKSLWLGNDRTVHLGLTNQKIFFDDDGNQIRNKKIEFSKVTPLPQLPRSEALKQLHDFYMYLQNNCNDFHPLPTQQLNLTNQLSQHVSVVGKHKKFPVTQDLWRSLVQIGVFEPDVGFRLYMINDNERSGGKDVVNQYISELISKCSLLKISPPEILRLSMDTLIDRLSDLSSLDSEKAVFVIPVEGQKGDLLPSKQKRLIDLLDFHNAPYRLFSYDNDKLKWSVSSQLISMLQATGTPPYHLDLQYPEDFSKGLFIGFDIGHSHENGSERFSNLSLSAIDARGAHILTVVKKHILNEHPTFDDFEEPLQLLIKHSQELTGYTFDKVIFLRDGYIAGQQRVGVAKKIQNCLQVPTTVIEFRKRGNPALYSHDGINNKVTSPTCVSFSWGDDQVRLFNAYEPMTDKGLARTFKINLVTEADDLDWGVDAYCRIIFGLCYSPSLGLKPHLPGPIYWADGVGKTSSKDHSFAGQRVIRLGA